jgi:hypothetical protein
MRQNLEVEADILFYKDYMIWHMLDRVDRWHVACSIPDKKAATLCDAIMTSWVQVFGPFKILVIDGEGGIASKEAKEFLNTQGIQIRLRAPNQHARMVERRGAILRHALHCAEEQLEAEGVPVTFPQLLAQAVFAGNSLITLYSLLDASLSTLFSPQNSAPHGVSFSETPRHTEFRKTKLRGHGVSENETPRGHGVSENKTPRDTEFCFSL